MFVRGSLRGMLCMWSGPNFSRFIPTIMLASVIAYFAFRGNEAGLFDFHEVLLSSVTNLSLSGTALLHPVSHST